MTRNQGTILCVGLITAAVIGAILLPARLVYPTGGALFVGLGIWVLVAGLRSRRDMTRGWGEIWNSPKVAAWRGIGSITLGLCHLSGLLLTERWAMVLRTAGTLVFAVTFILPLYGGGKNKGS